jgi:AraC-like DNA-binding protein
MATPQQMLHPASSLALALALMRADGHDADSCLKGTGLRLGDLEQAGQTVSLDREIVFYRNLLQLSQDPCIGLRIGKTYRPQHYGLFGYALLSAATVRQALVIASSFGDQLSFTWFSLSYEINGDRVRFQFRDRLTIDADVRNMLFDRDCAAFCLAAEEIIQQPLDLVHIELPHDGHRHGNVYTDYFGCPVSFDCNAVAVEFSGAVVDNPLPFRDALAFNELERQCQLLLSKLSRQGKLVEEVRHMLIARPGYFPSIEWVAEKFHVSVRTLRRQLSEEHASYQRILDEVRFGLAREYLLETTLPLHEIAALLGYTEPGNFTHAFKRWAGVTPYGFRQGAPAR